jgi:hypothetical protein
MNIIEENSQIPEMYTLRHKHDTESGDEGFNYSEKLLERTVSPVLYNNDNNVLFLEKFNNMLVTMYEYVLPVRNIFFYSHNKYYNKHGK